MKCFHLAFTLIDLVLRHMSVYCTLAPTTVSVQVCTDMQYSTLY